MLSLRSLMLAHGLLCLGVCTVAGAMLVASDIIGVDLTTSYGTAVVMSYNSMNHCEIKLDGDAEYQDLMERLSLSSSQHYSPPYNNLWEKIIDKPRQLLREARKAALMPASDTTRILAQHLQELHQKVYSECNNTSLQGTRIHPVLVSTPHLPGLYEEDILEAIANPRVLPEIALVPVNGYGGFDQPRVSIAAMAGNGWGLCSNFTDIEACEQEEDEMPVRRVYMVEYTDSSLHLKLQSIAVPRLGYEPYDEKNTLTSFDFNCYASLWEPDQESYWTNLGAFLAHLPGETMEDGPITDVQFSSDCEDNYLFGQVLDIVLERLQDTYPRYSMVDPLFLAARGSLELARRYDFKRRYTDLVEPTGSESNGVLGLQQVQ